MHVPLPVIFPHFPLLLLLGGFLIPAIPPAPAFAQGPIRIEFKDSDQAAKMLSLDDLAAITPADLTRCPDPDWQQAQEIVFTSIDGYQPSVPVAKFLAHDAYLAFAHEDGTPFKMTNKLQNNEIVQLGPLYLVWDNINSKALLTAGASDLPYQIKRIELKSTADFSNISPPPGSSAQAQRGFAHFRKHCIACHTINGQGGGKAPELNYPVSVVEYIKPEYLKRWIENPQSVRYNTAMPGLAKEIPNREKTIEELIAYLKAMSTAKRAPVINR